MLLDAAWFWLVVGQDCGILGYPGNTHMNIHVHTPAMLRFVASRL